MSVVALISTVCAFVFVAMRGSTLDEGVLESNEVGANARLSDGQGRSPLHAGDEDVVVEPEKKKETKKKNKVAKNEGKKKEDIDDTANEENDEGVLKNILVPLESIVVNLGGVESRRYLRVLINLGVENESAQNLVKENLVMLRDKMISILSSKSAESMETEESLQDLRIEIKENLNKLLGKDETIKQVYFSDFLIQ